MRARTGCGVHQQRDGECRGRELPAPLLRCVTLADAWLSDVEPPPSATIGPQYIDEAVTRGACDGPVKPTKLSTGHRCMENATFGCGPGRRQMWARRGCRGLFRCAGSTNDTACGYVGRSTYASPQMVRVCECA